MNEARTIFPICSLDRARVHWEAQLHTLTPVEAHGAIRFKREDYFAPLGYGGVNGAKVRQLLWVLGAYQRNLEGRSGGVVMAGSVHSPQLGRVAVVAKHLGLPLHIVLGSEAKERHENVAIAAAFGAQFTKAKAPYFNPHLQYQARQLLEAQCPSYYLLEYALSLEGPPERLEAFYRFCGEQAQNIPDDVETLLVPAGSGNTTLALLYAIVRYAPRALREVVLFGIGPTRLTWIEERLKLLAQASGLPLGDYYTRQYHHHPDLQARYAHGKTAPVQLVHYDLQTTGFAKYAQRMPAVAGGVTLHPVYEGKMWRYMEANPEQFGARLKSGKTLFWVVGSEATYAAMRPYLGAA